jgi:hypothetical protein
VTLGGLGVGDAPDRARCHGAYCCYRALVGLVALAPVSVASAPRRPARALGVARTCPVISSHQQPTAPRAAARRGTVRALRNNKSRSSRSTRSFSSPSRGSPHSPSPTPFPRWLPRLTSARGPRRREAGGGRRRRRRWGRTCASRRRPSPTASRSSATGWVHRAPLLAFLSVPRGRGFS